MYIMPDMIDRGLRAGQEWPTFAHKVVAQNIALCNSRVTNRDSLTEVVQAVLAIPKNKIRRVTLMQAASEYHVPFINLS